MLLPPKIVLDMTVVGIMLRYMYHAQLKSLISMKHIIYTYETTL